MQYRIKFNTSTFDTSFEESITATFGKFAVIERTRYYSRRVRIGRRVMTIQLVL